MSAMDGDNQANTGANKRTNSRARLKALARRQAAKRSFTTAPALTLALLAAPFAMMGRAEAACVTTGVNVDCTGANANQGAPTDTGLTYHMNTGATVAGGAANGIQFSDGAVNVDAGGAVTSATGAGIDGHFLTTVGNVGTISGADEVFSDNGVHVVNSGTITGTTFSGVASLTSLSLQQTGGTISGLTVGVDASSSADPYRLRPAPSGRPASAARAFSAEAALP